MTNIQNNFFSELENTRPFVKIGFEGFAGTGKTYTAAQIAIGIHKIIGSTKPIVFYDTEKSLKALKPFFDKEGIKVMVRESRTLADLSKTILHCEEGFSEILVIDSITHVWENFLTAYKAQKKRDQLYFQDWGVIKPKWKKEFSDRFVQSNLHIIFTGRAGYEYEETTNEQGKKELHKSGIKMKSENETAYEPDMLILMERFEDILGQKKQIWREATIIKDRTTLIDGKTFKNPTFKDFSPAVAVMLDGHVKERPAETPDKFVSMDDGQFAKKNAREIAIEEIKGVFDALGLGAGKEEKQLKAAIIEKIFGTLSMTSIESMELEKLQENIIILKDYKIKHQTYLKGLDGTQMSVTDLMDLLGESISEVKLFNE